MCFDTYAQTQMSLRRLFEYDKHNYVDTSERDGITWSRRFVSVSTVRFNLLTVRQTHTHTREHNSERFVFVFETISLAHTIKWIFFFDRQRMNENSIEIFNLNLKTFLTF